MILTNYKIKKVYQNKSQLFYQIFFDEVIVSLKADAKYSRLEMKINIKDGCKRRNVCLLKYLISINDFLESNTFIAK